ncbi:MAG: hypothetical protein U5K00_09515 [Melioribacteraceae bacterium]|nr:hypothetical protein [Melioribacteraceae bacterium]
MITKENVITAQIEWANGIIKIGKLKDNYTECKREAEAFVTRQYNYDHGRVLFKPTRASEKQFRLEKEGAISYFVGGNQKFPEDTGFALQPWTKIKFDNADIIIDENTAIAMGNYYLADTENNEVKVEYTIGFIKRDDGSLKINLHHSSFPFKK